MRHLSLPELARLVEAAPAASEREHLDRCDRCAGELIALREQTRMLSELKDPPVPAAITDRVLADLPGAVRAGSRPNPIRLPGIWRVAAAITLFVGGAAVGTFGVAPGLDSSAVAATTAAPPPADLDAAAEALAIAEEEYLRALSTFADMSSDDDGFDPVSRLAALEGIVLTTRAALEEAPADPVINNYHLTAIGQRDALIRRIERLTTTDEWF